jgi:hypothetical protein
MEKILRSQVLAILLRKDSFLNILLQYIELFVDA